MRPYLKAVKVKQMCGIGGFLLNSSKHHLSNANTIAKNMCDQMRLRGPDNEGYWSDSESGDIHLFHRRLSIIDLSSAGHQPMVSHNGRYVMTYNGEIYNYRELATELKNIGCSFKSTSDSEVILEGFSIWGIEATLKRLIGMFTIALWDNKQKKIHLMRDRLGIKPLYWSHIDGSYLFASTINAMQPFPYWKGDIDKKAVALYLYYGYVPAPYAIYQNVHKVQPGSIVTLQTGQEAQITQYWTLADQVNTRTHSDFFVSFSQSKEHIASLIEDSVSRRMISDVPFGAFLSGGIDSSLVVAMMQKASSKPVQTFSIGFEEQAFNEAGEAKKIANSLKTNHHELYINEQTLLDTVFDIHSYYDEPFYDSSAIPTFILSKLTRQHVTVALSGDGGDELFAGYNRYIWGQRIDQCRAFVPKFLLQLLGGTLKAVSPLMYDKLTNPIQKKMGLQAAGHKIHKLANCLLANNNDDMYQRLVSHWVDLYPNCFTQSQLHEIYQICLVPENLHACEERMQYVDMISYMNDDILTKVDRASMANSLEVRVPLIDHRLVEASWRVPREHKIYRGKTKYILREILKDYVPEHLFERPKMGFGVPLDKWLRGPLHDWAHSMLHDTAWQDLFGLDDKVIHQSWHQFLKYGGPSATHIWVLLSLSAWHRK